MSKVSIKNLSKNENVRKMSQQAQQQQPLTFPLTEVSKNSILFLFIAFLILLTHEGLHSYDIFRSWCQRVDQTTGSVHSQPTLPNC